MTAALLPPCTSSRHTHKKNHSFYLPPCKHIVQGASKSTNKLALQQANFNLPRPPNKHQCATLPQRMPGSSPCQEGAGPLFPWGEGGGARLKLHVWLSGPNRADDGLSRGGTMEVKGQCGTKAASFPRAIPQQQEESGQTPAAWWWHAECCSHNRQIVKQTCMQGPQRRMEQRGYVLMYIGRWV